MKFIQIVIGCTLLLFAVTGMAKQDKTLICHVGNELGPNGEEYDPNCVPDKFNGYCSADAGKIDLIVVAEKAAAKHLNNDSHSWDGISDYEPSDVDASGDGTEDSDGDGVDDGCEPVEPCPCWDVGDLMVVTADNNYTDSCSGNPFLPPYPMGALIENDEIDDPEVEGGFAASNGGGFPVACYTRDFLPGFLEITADEANACIEQIATRCAAIGDPITP